jgi:hypothetical protein
MPLSLDVKHITKNVCESLLGTLLNMPDRTKDGPKGRHDLEFMKIREDHHLGRSDDDDDDDDDDDEEETEGHRKGKGPRGTTTTAPLRASLYVLRRSSSFSTAS